MITFNKGVLELAHVDSRARASRSHLVLGWSQVRWIVFGSNLLGEEALQEDFGIVFSLDMFRSCIKIR